MRNPERIRRRNGTVVYQVRAPRPGGGVQYATFRTLREAQAYAAQLQTAREGGVLLNTNKKWDAVVEEFMSAHCVGLAPSAVAAYARGFKQLQPYIGGMLLRALTPRHFEQFRDAELLAIRARMRAATALAVERAERRLSAAVERKHDTTQLTARLAELRTRAVAVERAGTRAVNKSLGGARTLLRFSQARGYIASNPAGFCKKLKPQTLNDRPLEATIYTPAEANRLIEAADTWWRAALGVLAFGGLRISEMLATQWGDVEFDRGRILVRRQLCGVTGTFRAPKTKAGTRFVSLPQRVIAELRTHKLSCPKGLDLVFPNRDGGVMDPANFAHCAFLPAVRRAKLRRIRIHDLRHGAASYLIAAGADLSAVAKQLGHSTTAVTLGVYAHFVESRAGADHASKLEAYLAEQNGCVLVVGDNSAAAPGAEVVDKTGGPGRIRTYNQGIMSPLH